MGRKQKNTMKTKLTKTGEEGWLQLESIEEPTISQKTIEEIKEKLQEEDALELEDDEKKQLKEKRKSSGYDRITKGLLFIECLDKIKELTQTINNEEIKEYLKSVDIKELRNLIEQYGEGYGKYLTGEKIKDVVDENGEKIEFVINLFFEFFGGDD